MTDQEFVNKYYPYAERINREYNLKFSPYFWLGQWALESANGSNKWTTAGNNVSASNVTNGAQTPIIKSGRGQNYFPNLEAWYKNLVNNILNLGGSSTYSRAGFKEAKTINEAARAIVAGGYVGSSDPNKNIYAQSVTNRANALMKNTTPPKGSKIFSEESANVESSDTGNGTSYETLAPDSGDFNNFEKITPFLTFKNVLLYFAGLILLLIIIRYLNRGRGESTND